MRFTDSDPDFDWASNLIEHALGGSPDSNGDAPIRPSLHFDESGHAVFEVNRDKRQQDVAYSVWWSRDLTEWTRINLITEENTPTLLKVRSDRRIDTEESVFFRLRVVRGQP